MVKTPTVHVNLRLPPDLHRALVELAAALSPPVSLNQCITDVLRNAVNHHDEIMGRLRDEWQNLPQREKEYRTQEMIGAFVRSLEQGGDTRVTAKKKDVA